MGKMENTGDGRQKFVMRNAYVVLRKSKRYWMLWLGHP
jgi:hypothetical protein